MPGTVFPSFFGTVDRGAVSSNESLNRMALYVGEVKHVIYPDDARSISKKYVEYTVEAILRDGGGTSSSTLFHGCIAGQAFGGFADQLHYTLRGDPQSAKVAGIGSKVLLMCISGSGMNPVILSGLPDRAFFAQDGAKHASSEGHNLFFEFNGVQFTVNNDGELKLTFRGATNNDGTLNGNAVQQAEGSYIQVNKQGNIKVATPNDDQFVHIDHQNRRIEIQAENSWDCSITGSVNITAGSNVNIQSPGVLVGASTDSWMLGSTYRAAEGAMNAQLLAELTTLSGMMSTAGTALTTAGIINIIPIIGGLFAAPLFLTAGATLLSASPVFESMSMAITDFETMSSAYLSTKNRND